MRLALILVALCAGCRDYAALDRATIGDLGATDLGLADLATPTDGVPASGCTLPAVDLAGTTPILDGGLATAFTSLPVDTAPTAPIPQVLGGPFHANAAGLLTFDPSSSTVSVYEGKPGSTFVRTASGTLSSNGVRATSLFVGDWSGDGYADLVAFSSDGAVELYDAALTSGGILADSIADLTPATAVVADFDRDGKPDILVFYSASVTTNEMAVLHYGPFSSGRTTPVKVRTPVTHAVFDADDDCDPDIAFADSAGNGYVLRNQFPGALQVEGSAILAGAVQIARVTLTLAGHDGLFFLTSQGAYRFDYPTEAQAEFEFGITLDAFSLLSTGDLDRDGLTDVVAWTSMGKGYAFHTTSNDYFSLQGLALPSGVSPPLVLDVTGDGIADLVAGSTASGARPQIVKGLP